MLITKITSNTSANSNLSQLKTKEVQPIKNGCVKSDVYQKAPNFTGIKLPSGDYPINLVRYGKRAVAKGGDSWKVTLYDTAYAREKNSHGPILSKGIAKAGTAWDRFNVDLVTLGLGEIYFYLRKLADKQIAKDEVFNMTKIVNDLKNKKL